MVLLFGLVEENKVCCMIENFCFQYLYRAIFNKPGFVQDFDMQIQGVFKNFSRTKAKSFKQLQIPCVSTQEAQNTKTRHFSQISRSLINFQGKILTFKEFQVPLKWYFKLEHFSRTSRTSTNPVSPTT